MSAALNLPFDKPRERVHIVNPDPQYSRPTLIEPSNLGYIYVAASYHPGRMPFVFPSTERSRFVSKLKTLVEQLRGANGVVNATVFRSIVIPPTVRFNSYLKSLGTSLRAANFDVMVLVQLSSVHLAREIHSVPGMKAIINLLRAASRNTVVIPARNIRRIANVDTGTPGLFLFNHFVAEDKQLMLELWEYLADWYVKETGLNNSVALVPLEDSRQDFTIINWAKWQVSPLPHFLHQLANRGFWKYVAPNLEANCAAARCQFIAG